MSDPDPDRCFICLGDDGEAPPLARPHDSSKLVRVCPCSLRAHHRCLTDWAADTEYRTREEGGPFSGAWDTGRMVGVTVPLMGRSGTAVYKFIETKIRCPQCGAPVVVYIKPSRLLSLYGLIYSYTKEMSKASAIAIVGSAAGFALIVSVGGIFVSGGLQMFLSITPESVLSKLLDFKSKSLDQELKSNAIDFKQLFLIGSFPVFLFGLRSDLSYLDLFSTLYPIMFFNGTVKNFTNAGPKAYLLFTEPLKRLYWFFYSLTFNRVYYRWTREVKPIFLANYLSSEDLNEIEEENKALYSLKENSHEAKGGFFKRFFSNFFGESTEEKAIYRKKLWRDTKAILTRDFTGVFHSKSIYVKICTTILWPYLGGLLGKLLLKVVKINEFCNTYGSTPDESLYIANLLGGAAVVLVKDLIKLYIGRQKLNSFQNLGLVEFTTEPYPGR